MDVFTHPVSQFDELQGTSADDSLASVADGDLPNELYKRHESCVYTGAVDQWGLRHGHGEYRIVDGPGIGNTYIGEFVHDKKFGRGAYQWADGSRYEGDFRDDVMVGNGVFTWPEGDRYDGQFVNGMRHGKGVMYPAGGGVFYGYFKDDLPTHGLHQRVNGVKELVECKGSTEAIVSKDPKAIAKYEAAFFEK